MTSTASHLLSHVHLKIRLGLSFVDIAKQVLEVLRIMQKLFGRMIRKAKGKVN